MIMTEEVNNFIEENIELIEQQRWEESYRKRFPIGFTETLLESNINPLEQGLNYIPKYFLYNSNIKEFIIPNNVESIGYNAFRSCSSLTSVVIGDGVKTIGDAAFFDCESLKHVIIGNNVTSMGESLFWNCKSLISIKYLGTKREALTKLKVRNKLWREDSAISKIICTDGIIEL